MAALLPGTWYAWQWRSIPHTWQLHDDLLYYIGGKSLAETGSFRIESLPASPAQTKYPPLLPAVLSLAWHLNPRYPDNLPVAMLLCWMWLPMTLILVCRWLRSAGMPTHAVILIGAAWALNPYVIYFSTVMLSEMPFTAFLLAALLCLRPAESRHGLALAAAAGLLGGLAFLTRTAGVAILPAALLYYGLGRRWIHFGLFAAGMLPAVLGWTLWSAANRAPGIDSATLYYTNYFGYFLSSFQWGEAYLYVWKNLDGMIHGLGVLLLPDTTFSVFDKVLAECLAIAGLIGIGRLVGARPAQPAIVSYAAFAMAYVLMLTFWNFPPNERFMLPVAPLWLAGLYVEMKRMVQRVGAAFRKPDRSQRIAGGILAVSLAWVLVHCGDRQWSLLTDDLPGYHEQNARRLRESEGAIDWIRQNLPPEARFVSANDPLLYLRTGRRGTSLFPPTIHWYRGDSTARVAAYADIPRYGREQNFDYLLLNDWDWQADLPVEEHTRLMQSLRSDTRLEKVYSRGPTSILRIR